MSVSGSNGFAYDRLCKIAAGRGWKVGLEVGDGDPAANPPKASRLTRMWVHDKDGVELTAAVIPPDARLNGAAILLLDDLQVA